MVGRERGRRVEVEKEDKEIRKRERERCYEECRLLGCGAV
jgi:hypothetical protein